jgi:serine/threonine-protein kinase
MDSHDPSRLSPGDVIAQRYVIEEVLGVGGFGSVYRTTQIALGRQVAVKVLHASLASPIGLGRFRREARLAQQLEHPNTVRVFDFGETDGGVPFIVFELLRGRSLEEVLKVQGPMPPARAGRIAGQVLKSLMEAHELGVVHRDIKPENVFLTDHQGEPDFVKVLDFGVAKPLLPDSATVMDLTLGGEMIGTPNYMAPEQVRAEAVTPATDVYALGLVIAEMLTGKQVFTGPTAASVCFAQLSATPAPIPRGVLDSPLGPVVARATRKQSVERYLDAADMLAALEAAVRAMGEDRPPMPGPTGSDALRQLAETVLTGPSQGSPDPATVRRRSPGTVVVGTLAVAFLALGMAVAGVAGVKWMLGDEPGPDHREPRPVKTLEPPMMPPFNAPPGSPNQPAASPNAPSPNTPSRLGQVTHEQIRQRLESWSWRILHRSDIGPSGGMRATMYTVANDVYSGGVCLYDFDDPAQARMIAGSMNATGRAALGEGHRVLLVELRQANTAPVDTSASRALLEILLQ